MPARLFASLLILGGLSLASAGAAQAKISIPCTGDRIVKVRDIGIKRDDGKTVDLGYLFPGCFAEGQWVGYLGSSDSYVPLDPAGQQALLRAAGLTEAPPTPSRWQYPFDALLMEIILIVVLAGVGLWELAKSLRKRRQATA